MYHVASEPRGDACQTDRMKCVIPPVYRFATFRPDGTVSTVLDLCRLHLTYALDAYAQETTHARG